MTNIIEDTIKYIIQTQNAQFWGIVLLTICMILNAIISLPPSEIVITIVGGLLFRGGYFPFTVILFCIVFSNLIVACIL
jgi:membrane protein DedA with SNARE-associated domain